ncbi:MAG: hypothetical protein QXS85_01370 [Acidilobaceae archaeon]
MSLVWLARTGVEEPERKSRVSVSEDEEELEFYKASYYALGC